MKFWISLVVLGLSFPAFADPTPEQKATEEEWLFHKSKSWISYDYRVWPTDYQIWTATEVWRVPGGSVSVFAKPLFEYPETGGIDLKDGSGRKVVTRRPRLMFVFDGNVWTADLKMQFLSRDGLDARKGYQFHLKPSAKSDKSCTVLEIWDNGKAVYTAPWGKE